MKKVTGIILFTGFLVGLLVIMYVVVDDYFNREEWENNLRSGEKLLFILLIILFSTGLYYVIATKFGSTKPTVLDDLEKENEIIKKQIEKKELLAKLESLEKQ